ncbi:hypothetical protein CDAR_429871 [Caerostris darwini]|uniref:Uncharacterized protein n=1 Tax=Caerostris darwini TaxID=1538125 RepID=A0AAV4TSI9_9ARAC|nr:hypothetical protein CDAR_429871 [Caerostris darwini]
MYAADFALIKWGGSQVFLLLFSSRGKVDERLGGWWICGKISSSSNSKKRGGEKRRLARLIGEKRRELARTSRFKVPPVGLAYAPGFKRKRINSSFEFGEETGGTKRVAKRRNNKSGAEIFDMRYVMVVALQF